MHLKLLYFDLHLPFHLNGDKKYIGGTAVEWRNWFHGFKKNGVEIELLTWKGARQYIKKKHDITIRESYDPNKGIRILRVPFYRIPVLYKSIKDSQATHLIQQNGSWIAGVLSLIAKIQKKAFILRIANDPDAKFWSSPKLLIKDKIGYRLAIQFADQISCQNRYQFGLLKKKYPQKIIKIIPKPIIIGKRIQKISKNRSYIAWLGKFTPQKNLPLLLQITKALPNIIFKVVGQTANATSPVDLATVIELKKLKNVEIIDWIDLEKIQAFLKNSILLLNTSNFEGLSNTFLEALLAGVPILAMPNVDHDGMISKYELGFVAKDHTEIINTIQNISKNFDYQSFYSHSYAFVKRNFNSINQASKFITYLQE